MTTNASMEPPAIMVYGPPGWGKTTELLYSFPEAIFIAADGALNPAKSLCGFTPNQKNAENLEEACEILKNNDGKTIVVDDFSFLVENTFQGLEKKFKDGRQFWGNVRANVLKFRNLARTCGTTVIVNCHETGPKVSDTGMVKGGPKLSGKLPEDLPGIFDQALRLVAKDSLSDRIGWHAAFEALGPADPEWTTKDRFHVVNQLKDCPANLREVLRAVELYSPVKVGWKVSEIAPRLKSTPWMNDLVDTLAKKFAANSDSSVMKANALAAWPKILEVVGKRMGAGVDIARVRAFAKWALRDAVDRDYLERGLRHAYDFPLNGMEG